MSVLRICRICGKEFISKSPRRTVCYDRHTVRCVVCGDEFELTEWPYTQKTCSTKCKRIHMRSAGMQERKCEFCGEPYVPESPRQKYCKRKHYLPCPICGTLVEVDPVIGKPVGCSPECTNKLREMTNVELYGVPNAGALPEFIEKRQDTCFERHGVRDYFDHPDFKKKADETKMLKYGTLNMAEVPDIIAKREYHSFITYGVRHPLQAQSVRDKISATMMRLYGVPHYVMTEDCQSARNGHKCSKLNKYVRDILIKKYPDILTEKYIGGQWFDLYIPSKNIVIEINPTVSHTTEFDMYHPDRPGLPIDYHLQKRLLAESFGYTCVTVFEWTSMLDMCAVIEGSPFVTRPIQLHWSDPEPRKNISIDRSKLLPVYDDGVTFTTNLGGKLLKDVLYDLYCKVHPPYTVE